MLQYPLLLGNMKYTYPSVFEAIQRLIMRDPHRTWTYEDIKAESGVSVPSVARAVPCLEAQELIKRHGRGKRGSFRYEVLVDAYPKRISRPDAQQ